MSEPGSRKDDPEGAREGSFRVIDRRRFTADGSERNPEDEAAEAAATARAPRPEPPPRRVPEPERPPDPELAEPRGEPYGDERFAAMEPSFSTLLMSLSTQALMCLGEIPEVAGEAPRRDLAAARSVIDLIGVLERKTRGNLDEGEAALLERILYDLRMRFVELSRT